MQQDVSEWLVDEFMLLMWCYLLRGMSCSPYQPFVVVLFFKSKYRFNFNVVYAQTETLHAN